MSTTHEPNEYGFGGAGTAPDARPDESRDESDEERTAVPDDDLTGPLADELADTEQAGEDPRP